MHVELARAQARYLHIEVWEELSKFGGIYRKLQSRVHLFRSLEMPVRLCCSADLVSVEHRPIFHYVARRNDERGVVSEFSVCLALSLVLVCSLLTDIIGIHPIFG